MSLVIDSPSASIIMRHYIRKLICDPPYVLSKKLKMHWIDRLKHMLTLTALYMDVII